MRNTLDFSSNNIFLYLILLDESSSMSDDRNNVINGFENFRREFEEFDEKGSIAVSVSKFSNSFYPSNFNKIENLKFSYNPDGATALYYSICEGADMLNQYIKEVIKECNTIPTATFIVFSDGEPCFDKATEYDAYRKIEALNNAGINTVFVAFGDAITSGFGKRLGFQATKDVTNRKVISEFLVKDLSNSVKEQSKSMKPLGANFFSGAADSSSNYSQKTNQALDDEDWISDI